MALKSKFPDLSIAEKVPWTEFVYGNFDSYGNRTAIVDGYSGKCYTYSQLKELTARCSSALKKRGFGREDVIAIYCPNSPEYPIIFFAVTSFGGIVTTVNPLYTTEELTQQLVDSESKCLFTVPELLEDARKACRRARIVDSNIFVVGKADGHESLSALCEEEAEILEATGDIDAKGDVAFLPYSSGITGLSKGVMLTHYNLVAGTSIASVKGMFDFDKSSVILGVLPFFHSYSMVAILSVTLYQGGKVVCVPRFEQETILGVIQQHKITHAPLVPPIISALLRNPRLEDFDLSRLTSIFSGASTLAKDTSNKLKLRLPHIKYVREGYGMTELSPVSLLGPATKESKIGSAGVLLPNMECKVVCVETGKTLGPKQDGELHVRGPTVMKGYLHNLEATNLTVDSDGWLHTGDVARYDDDGHFYIVDRLKELIKCRGYQVPPAELEQLLISHPDIEDAAVIGLPEIDEGEVPKAFVVKRACNLTEDDVISFVSERVASYKKLEGGVEFIHEIPKSISGKILRQALKEKELTRLQAELEEEESEDESEDWLQSESELLQKEVPPSSPAPTMASSNNQVQNKSEKLTSRKQIQAADKKDVVYTPQLKQEDSMINSGLASKNPTLRDNRTRRASKDSPPIKSSTSCNIV